MDKNRRNIGKPRRQIHTRRIQTSLGRQIGIHRAHKRMDTNRRKMGKPRRQIHTWRIQTNLGKEITKRQKNQVGSRKAKHGISYKDEKKEEP
eukprot:11387544-Heterocapsa_arctica.AAC.1